MPEWKEIKEYPDYAISNAGQVKSLRFNRLLKVSIGSSKYAYVNLIRNKVVKSTAVHRLVIEHFGIVPAEANVVVDHIDSNKTNNKISNLAWVTVRENTLRAYGNYDKKVKILELRARGLTMKLISEQVGMSLSAVQQTIARSKIV